MTSSRRRPRRTSAEVQALIDAWSHGYTPTPESQRYFKSQYRNDFTAALDSLIDRAKGVDELELLTLYRQFGEWLEQRDSKLRTELAGDRWMDTGKAAA